MHIEALKAIKNKVDSCGDKAPVIINDCKEQDNAVLKYQDRVNKNEREVSEYLNRIDSLATDTFQKGQVIVKQQRKIKKSTIVIIFEAVIMMAIIILKGTK